MILLARERFSLLPVAYPVDTLRKYTQKQTEESIPNQQNLHPSLSPTASSMHCADRSFASLVVLPAPTVGGGGGQGRRSAASGAMLHSTSKVTAEQQ